MFTTVIHSVSGIFDSVAYINQMFTTVIHSVSGIIKMFTTVIRYMPVRLALAPPTRLLICHARMLLSGILTPAGKLCRSNAGFPPKAAGMT
jgi:hypothetical protein